jgi:hypothetical protein
MQSLGSFEQVSTFEFRTCVYESTVSELPSLFTVRFTIGEIELRGDQTFSNINKVSKMHYYTCIALAVIDKYFLSLR